MFIYILKPPNNHHIWQFVHKCRKIPSSAFKEKDSALIWHLRPLHFSIYPSSSNQFLVIFRATICQFSADYLQAWEPLNTTLIKKKISDSRLQSISLTDILLEEVSFRLDRSRSGTGRSSNLYFLLFGFLAAQEIRFEDFLIIKNRHWYASAAIPSGPPALVIDVIYNWREAEISLIFTKLTEQYSHLYRQECQKATLLFG